MHMTMLIFRHFNYIVAMHFPVYYLGYIHKNIFNTSSEDFLYILTNSINETEYRAVPIK